MSISKELLREHDEKYGTASPSGIREKETESSILQLFMSLPPEEREDVAAAIEVTCRALRPGEIKKRHERPREGDAGKHAYRGFEIKIIRTTPWARSYEACYYWWTAYSPSRSITSQDAIHLKSIDAFTEAKEEIDTYWGYEE